MEIASHHNLMEEIEDAKEVKSAQKLTELRSNDAFHFHDMACEFSFGFVLTIVNFHAIDKSHR